MKKQSPEGNSGQEPTGRRLSVDEIKEKRVQAVCLGTKDGDAVLSSLMLLPFAAIRFVSMLSHSRRCCLSAGTMWPLSPGFPIPGPFLPMLPP